MPLSKKRQAEWMREQEFYRVKVGECCACHRIAPINKHHPDYSKPDETLQLCASCHKKVHMILNGTQRKHSNPYKNPLDKIIPKHLPNCPDGRYRPVDKKGKPIYDY